MFHVVCGSAASHLLSRAELRALLEETGRTNARHDITGMLLYKDGTLLQVLEGEQEAVMNLVRTIREDPRYKGSCILLSETTEERLFPDWRMAYRDQPDNSVLQSPGYSDFLNTPFSEDQSSEELPRCMRLLLSFKKNM